MNTLAEMINKSNIESINYALDLAISFEKKKFELHKLDNAIKVAKGYLKSIMYLIEKGRKKL